MIDAKRLVAIALVTAVGFPLFVSTPDQAAPICSAGTCTCKGDDECNDMFSNKCADTKGSASCQVTGDATVCHCAEKIVNSPSQSAPPKIGLGAAQPVQTIKPAENAR